MVRILSLLKYSERKNILTMLFSLNFKLYFTLPCQIFYTYNYLYSLCSIPNHKLKVRIITAYLIVRKTMHITETFQPTTKIHVQNHMTQDIFINIGIFLHDTKNKMLTNWKIHVHLGWRFWGNTVCDSFPISRISCLVRTKSNDIACGSSVGRKRSNRWQEGLPFHFCKFVTTKSSLEKWNLG